MATTTARHASKTFDYFVAPLSIRRISLTRSSGALWGEAAHQVALSRLKPGAFDTALREPHLGHESRCLSISVRPQHSSSSRRSRRLT